MSILMKTLVTLACLVLCALGACASATNVYIAQNATGAANGADCADAEPVSFFNTSGNWGSGSSHIGPGTTVHLCGTFTGGPGSTMLTIQGSGSSGNPITVLFEPGAQLNAPYWGGNPFNGNNGAAIVCAGFNYITIDGGANGTVQNTANGTGLMYQQGSAGVYFQDCSNPTIKNLTISNIYLKTNVNDEVEQGVGLWLVGGNNWLVTNNIINNALYPISTGWDANNVTTSGLISYNTIDYGCHMINGPGDGSPNIAASNITIDHNTIGPHNAIWNDPATSCHGNGIGPSGVQNQGSSLTNYTISNNTVTSDMCASGGNCTGLIFVGGATGLNIFNNVVQYVNGGSSESLVRLAGSVYPETNVSVYNNTLIGLGSSGTAIKMDQITNLVAKNNIIESMGQAWWDNTNTSPSFSQFSSGSSSNNNVYYGMAVRIAMGISLLNFAQWQATGFDAAGTQQNPLLGNNYGPQAGSAAIGMGVNLSSLSLSALDSDKAGTPRPASGSWVAGAYQANLAGPAAPSGLTAAVE